MLGKGDNCLRARRSSSVDDDDGGGGVNPQEDDDDVFSPTSLVCFE